MTNQNILPSVVRVTVKGKLSGLMRLSPEKPTVGVSVYSKNRKEIGKVIGEWRQPVNYKVSIEFYSPHDILCLLEGLYLGKKSGLLKVNKRGRLVRLKKRN